MIARNKLIKMNVNNVEYTFKNFMMDEYLKMFVDYQMGRESVSLQYIAKTMPYVYLKIEEPIAYEVTPQSEITPNDFDVSIFRTNYLQIGNKNSVEINYQYDLEQVFTYRGETTDNKELIKNKKIYALGFGTGARILAYVDISAYNISVQDVGTFSITRQDLFTSDAVCVGADLPIHIAPAGQPIYDLYGKRHDSYYSYLYSVGLGYNKGILANEYIIGTDITLNRKDDFTYSINVDVGDKNAKEKLPHIKQFARSNLYPATQSFKYLIYKYKMYNSSGETDKYYTMNYEIKDYGNVEVKTILERSEYNG